MARDFTILIDKREKTPLLFPDHVTILSPHALPHLRKSLLIRLHWEEAHLKTADYGPKGFLRRILVERKKHFTELARNCLTREGRRKFTDECQRLRDECDHPYLLVEGTVPHLLRTYAPISDESPWLAVDAYLRLCLEYGIGTIYLPSTSRPQRLQVGEYVAHLLINGAMT